MFPRPQFTSHDLPSTMYHAYILLHSRTTSTPKGSTTRCVPCQPVCQDRLASFSSASTPHSLLGSEITCFKRVCFISTVPSPPALTLLP